MLEDLEVSKFLTDEFEKKFLQDQDYKVTVKALNKHNWHIESEVPLCNLPTNISRSYDSLKSFYAKANLRKVLNLQHFESFAEVYFFFEDAYSRKLCESTLKVNNYQLSVLMLFNDREWWKVSEIQEVTRIPWKLLRQVISSLCFPANSDDVLRRFSNSSDRIILPNDLLTVKDTFTARQIDPEIPISFPMADSEGPYPVTGNSLMTTILGIVKKNKTVHQSTLMDGIYEVFVDNVTLDDINREISSLLDLKFFTGELHEDNTVSYQ